MLWFYFQGSSLERDPWTVMQMIGPVIYQVSNKTICSVLIINCKVNVFESDDNFANHIFFLCIHQVCLRVIHK